MLSAAKMGLKNNNPPYKRQKIMFLEYGHLGYHTFCDTPTKRLVKTPGFCDLTGLRKVQKCVFFV